MKPGKNRPRTAILGIGHALRGDDAAGLEVARRLRPLAEGDPSLLVIEAGPAPESFSGPLRRFAPDQVVLVDAAQMGEQPGTLRWLDWGECGGISFSSHTFPIEYFAWFLVSELGCEVRLLGIQPGDNSLDAPLSIEVERAVEEAVERLNRLE